MIHQRYYVKLLPKDPPKFVVPTFCHQSFLSFRKKRIFPPAKIFQTSNLHVNLDVSKNNGIPKSSNKQLRFSMMFTIHFGGFYPLRTPWTSKPWREVLNHPHLGLSLKPGQIYAFCQLESKCKGDRSKVWRF